MRLSIAHKGSRAQEMLGKWIGVAMGKLLLQLVPGMWLSAALAPVPSRMRQRAP